jgi:hypothetical protein
MAPKNVTSQSQHVTNVTKNVTKKTPKLCFVTEK